MPDIKVSLVTGGAGFIGSHLCDALLNLNHRVFCLDNLVTGREDNLDKAKSHPQFTFINYDVTKEIPLLGKIDYIFHLASPASVPDYQKYSEETALVNSLGTRNMLQTAKAYGAKFLFTSTSEVYGDPKEHPQNESYWGNVNPNGLRACYDESKRFGEMITMLYNRKFNIDARIVRIFNTYGPRMRPTDGRVISNFINQALVNKPLTVYGQGTQTRSFCFISDMTAGILSAMFSEESKGEVINLGNPEESTVIKLAEKIIFLTKSKSTVTYKALPPDDPTLRRPDITKAGNLLQWKPLISIDQGLKMTIEYYRNL